MHVVKPPSGLTALSNGSGGVDLSWNTPDDNVLGYHVYRAPSAAGPFIRINAQLLVSTQYVDSVSASNVYMVRAVKLEETPSGSYFNASQGILQDFSPSTAPLPILTIKAQSTNRVYGAPAPGFTALYSGFVNGDTPASLASLPLLTCSATTTSPPGAYPIVRRRRSHYQLYSGLRARLSHGHPGDHHRSGQFLPESGSGRAGGPFNLRYHGDPPGPRSSNRSRSVQD